MRVLSVPTEDVSNQYPIKKVKLSCPFHESAKFPFNLNRVILAFSAMYFICIPSGIIYKWFKGFNTMPILIKIMVRDQHVYCLTTSSRSKFSQYRAITWKVVERISVFIIHNPVHHMTKYRNSVGRNWTSMQRFVMNGWLPHNNPTRYH